MSDGWPDEIDLDPQGAWLRMGTRKLGGLPWLVADERRAAELALKRHLMVTVPDLVFAATADSGDAGDETLALVGTDPAVSAATEPGAAVESVADDGRHPLERAGLLTQEDLCLLKPVDGRWVLAAASLCFPSRWALADKFNQPLALVHQPVPGYEDVLADRVDRLLNRLDRTIVWRRNWFIHPDPSLFQPRRPPAGDPVIPAAHCLDQLYLRSERQTLRRLPASGWVLFTIRVQQVALRRFVAAPARRRALTRWTAEADPSLADHKGVSRSQVEQLHRALTDREVESRL